MKNALAATAACLLAIVAGIGIAWIVQGNDFFLRAYFAPKYEAVRRETVIQSQAYSEATTRRLHDLRRQYTQARSDDEKAAIKAMAIHEASAFDANRLPPDLRLFLAQLNR
jgi:hypothetical protein